jgi:hypothetical protein
MITMIIMIITRRIMRIIYIYIIIMIMIIIYYNYCLFDHKLPQWPPLSSLAASHPGQASKGRCPRN